MRTFMWIWSGQLLSLLGSSLTAFALPIWIFNQTGRVQELALLNLAFLLPAIFMSPVAGTIIDRSNRKTMMILSDLAAALATVTVVTLVSLGRLEVWHLYITTAFKGAFYTFQWPAFSAIISTMLSKEQYGRAAGLNSLAQSVSEIGGPLLAGGLLLLVGLPGILVIDLLTFAFAVTVLLLVKVPQPPPSEDGALVAGHFWRETVYGLRYLLARPSLLGLQLVFTGCNFVSSLALTGLAAMVLARSGQDVSVWSWVSAAGGIGGLLGGALMSAWGGPRRRIHGVLLAWMACGLLGLLPLGLGRSWLSWVIGMFGYVFTVPIMNGSNQAIWQSKVAPDLQGRVFALRRMLAWIALPLAKLLAIPLVDRWLEPGMQPGGALIPVLEWLVGSGPGAGAAVLFVVSGIGVVVLSLSAYTLPLVRDVEQREPDHALAPAPS
ncbi:MAG: MFS transporter [Chloroflexi bacterium]|nr:MAG: MFS transporter [Chloroflexota bacterium]